MNGLEIEECGVCGALSWCIETHSAKVPRVCQPCHAERFFRFVLLKPLGFQALPWQVDFIRRAMAIDFDSGYPRYGTCYVEVPKKNAKSFTSAFFPLYRMMFPLTPQTRCYGAASSRDQAAIVFNTAATMVNQSPILKDDLKLVESSRRIVRRDGRGVYQVISADGDIWDGIEPAVAVEDELHRWKTSKAQALYHAIAKGTISSPWAQVIQITTAGDPQASPLWLRQRQRAELALANPSSDRRFLPIIHRADPEKAAADTQYWMTRAARVEANPSHEDNGGYLRDDAIAEMMADGDSAYRRFHLNLPSQEEDRFLPLEEWTACRAPLAPFMGRRAIAGFDLSADTDFTALAILYEGVDGSCDLKVHCYVPREHLARLERITHQPLRDWVAAGHLVATPGKTVEYEAVRRQLLLSREISIVHAVGYDRRFAADLVKRLEGDRFICHPIAQGPEGMTGAVQQFRRLVSARLIRHEGNPCMDWMVACTTVKVSDEGGLKPDRSGERQTKADRIDGVSATLTALAALAKFPPVESGYKRGIVFA